MKSWAEISEHRLAANLNALQQAAGADVSLLPVVKANAYGHGAELCAPMLARAGAPWLSVADAVEGEAVQRALSAAGIAPQDQPRVLVLCGPLDEAARILEHRLTPVIWTRDQVEKLSAAAKQRGSGSSIAVHLEIDSGMTRQGVSVEALPPLLDLLKHTTLRVEGVMTHFASAEVAGSTQTRAQREQFTRAVHMVRETGEHPAWLHAGSSSTLDNDPAEASLCWLRELAVRTGARAMVRPGIALYGHCLPIENNAQTETSAQPESKTQPQIRNQLQPVMTWKTRIMDIRDVRPGDAIGYNATFVAPHPMRLALLPVGYSDGLRRELSSTNTRAGGWAIVRGQRAPIAGRISMNLTTIDVTNIHGVSLDDEAVLLGDGITADDHARLAGTISYEILCGVRPQRRLPA